MYRNNNYNRQRNNNSFHKNGNSFAKKFSSNKRSDVSLYVNKAVTAETESFTPTLLFSDFQIKNELKNNILAHGFAKPTEIQEKTIPEILHGRDVIGIANTGTGKTAAFLIPVLNKILTNRREKVMIVVPTRELAMQILDEFNIFAKNLGIHAALCIGGANMKRQEMNLRQNPSVVIGTPGRLKDLTQRRKLFLSSFRTIILDEVDRMVDIGFIKDIEFFISLLPKTRQSLFFSATLPQKLNRIVRSFVTSPVTVSIKKRDTSETIEQNVIRIPNKNKKIEVLHDLLIKDEVCKVMVFGRTKWGIEKLTRELIQRGFKAASIHGNKSQGQRQLALAQFKKNEINILLATDVASRGLDIDDVSHVINYDLPQSYDDYIHRIGRTGRAGKKGMALTFVEG